VCGFACNTNFGDCDGNKTNGCEANLNNNSENCGTCGTTCCGGGTCSTGSCQPKELVAESVSTFDIDNTNVYSVSGNTLNKTPKAGGTTAPLTATTVYASQVFTNGVDVFWGWRYNGLEQYGTYAISVTGGPITTINNDGIEKVSFALDSSDIFWADASGGPEVTWHSTTASGTTLAASANYTADMVSDGTNLYYIDQYHEPGNPDYPCSNGAQGYAVRSIPVHGGTPMAGGIAVACGTYANLTLDSNNLYYTESDYTPDAANGTWSIALNGLGAATQIAKTAGPMASDGTDLFICASTDVLYKMPVAGGALVQVASSCSSNGLVKVDNQCVYYTASGLWTVNK
jgi:hypothetical protein